MKDELNGKNIPIDPDAIYITIKELCKKIGVDKSTIAKHIRDGKLKGRKTSMPGRRGDIWVVHPDDAEKYVKEWNIKVQ